MGTSGISGDRFPQEANDPKIFKSPTFSNHVIYAGAGRPRGVRGVRVAAAVRQDVVGTRVATSASSGGTFSAPSAGTSGDPGGAWRRPSWVRGSPGPAYPTRGKTQKNFRVQLFEVT